MGQTATVKEGGRFSQMHFFYIFWTLRLSRSSDFGFDENFLVGSETSNNLYIQGLLYLTKWMPKVRENTCPLYLSRLLFFCNG